MNRVREQAPMEDNQNIPKNWFSKNYFLQFLAYSRRGFKMSEEKQITSAEFGRRLIEDNRELIRIIANALYPAIEQLKLYQEAREDIRSMKWN